MSSKIALYIIGMFVCIPQIFSQEYKLRKEFRGVLMLSTIIVLWDIIISAINGNTEFHLIKAVVTVVGSLFASELIFRVSKKEIGTTSKLMLIISVTVFLESLISLCIKVSPELYSIFDRIQEFQVTDENYTIIGIEEYTRFIGLGNAVTFGVLNSCALGLSACSFLLFNIKQKANKVFILLMYLFIAVISFFIARTSIVIFAISLFSILFTINIKKMGMIIKSLAIIIVVVVIAYPIIIRNLDNPTINWAFSFLIEKDLESGSAGQVIDWWFNTEVDIKTFFIGDARFEGISGGYYKNVDVGFYRELFYGGIISLSLLIYFHYKLLKDIYKSDKSANLKGLCICLFLCYIAAMAKGDTFMLSNFILILVFTKKGLFKRDNNRITNYGKVAINSLANG